MKEKNLNQENSNLQEGKNEFGKSNAGSNNIDFNIDIDFDEYFKEMKAEQERKFNHLIEILNQKHEANKITEYEIDRIINYLNNKGDLKWKT